MFTTALLLGIAMACYILASSPEPLADFDLPVTLLSLWTAASTLMAFVGFQLGIRGLLPGTRGFR